MGMLYHRHNMVKDGEKKPRPQPDVAVKDEAAPPKKRSTKKATTSDK